MSKGSNNGKPTEADVAAYGFGGWIAPDAGENTDPQGFGGGVANHDTAYAEQAAAFLATQTPESTADTPFALIVSFVNPHDGIVRLRDQAVHVVRCAMNTVPLPSSTRHRLPTEIMSYAVWGLFPLFAALSRWGRTIDQHGRVLDRWVPRRRTQAAAKTFFGKLLQRGQDGPQVISTENRARDGAAPRELLSPGSIVNGCGSRIARSTPPQRVCGRGSCVGGKRPVTPHAVVPRMASLVRTVGSAVIAVQPPRSVRFAKLGLRHGPR